jgi:hypothetical protein
MSYLSIRSSASEDRINTSQRYLVDKSMVCTETAHRHNSIHTKAKKDVGVDWERCGGGGIEGLEISF